MIRILHKLAGPAVLLLGVVLTQPAAAQADLSLGASAPRAVLSDLAPGDGIAPALRWQPYTRQMDGLLMTKRGDLPLFTRQAEAPDDGSTLLEFDWQGVTGVRAEVLPAGAGPAGASVSVFAGHGGLADHYAFASSVVRSSFALAPQTMAQISVDFMLALLAREPASGWDGGWVIGSLAGGFEDVTIPSFGYESLLDEVGPSAGGYGAGIARETTLGILLVNDTDAWATGFVAVNLTAIAQNVPGPVPEAPPWAMFAGGLLACAGLGRQRAKARFRRREAEHARPCRAATDSGSSRS